MLKDLHDKLLKDYGLCLELRPLYYSTENSIRFEIGTDKRASGGISYSDSAYLRAKSIYDELYNDNNVLILYDNYKEDSKELTYMQNTILSNFNMESFDLDTDLHNSVDSRRYMFKLNSEDIKVDKLLKCIIGKESDGNDSYYFASSVYIFNLDTGMLFYLYDDRGLDVASVQLQDLKSLYNKYKGWLLPEVLADLGAELE